MSKPNFTSARVCCACVLVPLTFLATTQPDAYVAPKHYVCFRRAASLTIDGRLEEAAWRTTPWSDEFVDIEGDRKARPRFRTRVKMLWDDDYFYIAADLEEPHVWATLTKHDSVIFHDNDFEAFIDPDGDNHNYGEFEINALGTGWDLRLPKPYKDGGKADDGWEIAGLKTAVHTTGTLNDPRDSDCGWTVEIAIPWRAIATLADEAAPIRPARRSGPVFEGYEDSPAAGAQPATPRRRPDRSGPPNQPAPPKDGDQWRVNFSRVEWRHEVAGGNYRKVPNHREDNWVWSPQWTINMHRPETWGSVQFSTAHAGSPAAGGVRYRPDPAGPAKHLLHRIYYAQHQFRSKHKRFATLAELGLRVGQIDGLAAGPQISADDEHFQATIEVRSPDGGITRWHIREDSRVWHD